jgi:hypothetical protein
VHGLHVRIEPLDAVGISGTLEEFLRRLPLYLALKPVAISAKREQVLFCKRRGQGRERQRKSRSGQRAEVIGHGTRR